MENAQQTHSTVSTPPSSRETMAPQWEVFVRGERTESLRHVGSVSAVDATDARQHATRLFGWDAIDLWCCPAASVERLTSRAGEYDLVGETEADPQTEDAGR
ncbi:Htur_1727 family rSAM-partnered candidate RiPP [Halovivax gelatinilyticus]|uniref:Htur_1727 family rSAM-partnered candidate RiPP n=1 Tax=Halovivax gelatinilyticus TaxID=2961597 RepID=UPI0020CA50DC|nr:Htur_1727 family rSAM-partnered candidate RiPP [Halovivax gelatinilyticus]